MRQSGNTSANRVLNILFGVTTGSTARSFLTGQLIHLRQDDYGIHLVTGDNGHEDFALRENLNGLHVVPMKRDPSVRDLQSMVSLIATIRRIRPDVTVMGTPKMGVFGTIAAWVTRVPTRVYLIHGYRAEGMSGLPKILMETLERISCRCATHVVAVSDSLKDFLVSSGVATENKVRVLGYGSANGIDIETFTPVVSSSKEALREKWGVPGDAEVIAVVGRLTADKGLQQLPTLARSLQESRPKVRVLIAGRQEVTGPEDTEAIHQLESSPGVHLLGNVDQVQEVFQAADVHVLLSAREGLGMVALEASACGIPTIAYEATGVVDAILDNETGLLVPQGDLAALQSGVEKLLDDTHVRQQFSDAGISMVKRRYQREDVWANWSHFFEEVTRKQDAV